MQKRSQIESSKTAGNVPLSDPSTTAGAGRTTYIHVNRNTVASNAKHGTDKPAVRFQRGKYGKATYAHEVEIQGPSRVIYSPHERLLPCGARLIIATEAGVRVVR